MNKNMKNNSGATLIATVLALLIFSLFIAIAVSLVTTGSNISLQEEQGTQSLFIADGGLEFGAVFNFPNHDGWPTPVANQPLGTGTFTLTVPTLSANIDNAVTTINVSSTDGFQTAPDGNYWVMMCDVFASGNARPNVTAPTDCEKISFPDTSFTGGTRGRHSSIAVQHLQNAVVIMYTWDTSVTTTTNGGPTPGNRTKICVNSTSGFTMPGTVQMVNANDDNIEDVLCQSIGTPATCSVAPACPGACFTTCTRRAYDGNGNGFNQADGTTIYQSEISVLTTSTGTISNVLAGSVTRKVQGALMPLQ